jgi:hypothetical protein
METNKEINEFIKNYLSEMVSQLGEKNITEKVSKYVISTPPNYVLPEHLQIIQKKKRNKQIVPDVERCMAKRANGERCTRRHRDDSHYCGTHHESRPHGEIQADGDEAALTKKLLIHTQEINGIIYYIDNEFNIYNTMDVLKGSTSPAIIGKYKCYMIDEDNEKQYLDEREPECFYEVMMS